MFISTITNTENSQLRNCFPFSLRQDVEEAIKALPSDRWVLLADGQIHNIDKLIHPNKQPVVLDGKLLEVPCRVYFNEPQAKIEQRLTTLQKIILNCIYLRHHNGFVRQRRLELLLNSEDYFVIPYTFQLLGEYVIEILEVLDRHINEKTFDNYAKFINENRKYYKQTESRMISYWNEYYRQQFPKLKSYIGKQIIEKLKANA